MGPVRASTLVERTTRYLIIVALPLGRRADQVCDALTRRIQGLPEGAMRTLTWDQGPEMAPPPPTPHPRHGRGGVFRSPPQPLGERNQRKHQPAHPPLPAQRNPHHQPYLDAIAYEPGNCPRAALDYHTPTEAFNQLIATTH